MSIEDVASRAGVGKAAIYRRWSSRGALALDAFLAEFQAQQPLPDTGTLRGDLLAALRAWVRSRAGRLATLPASYLVCRRLSWPWAGP